MMKNHDYTAWLGPAAEQLTDDQRCAFDRVAGELNARYPERDAAGEPTDDTRGGEGMTGACMVLLGDATLAELAGDWSRARVVERDAMARLTGAIMATVEQGATEADIVRATGITRRTIRKAMGR